MIGIQGIRIKDLDIKPSTEGKGMVTGTYALMSTTDRVLATQGFNGYSDIEVQFSAETLSALTKFLAGVKNDLNRVLGLEEGETK